MLGSEKARRVTAPPTWTDRSRSPPRDRARQKRARRLMPLNVKLEETQTYAKLQLRVSRGGGGAGVRRKEQRWPRGRRRPLGVAVSSLMVVTVS